MIVSLVTRDALTSSVNDNTGGVLSIQFTLAVDSHVFPAVSVNLNTYDQFAVNVLTFVHAGD